MSQQNPIRVFVTHNWHDSDDYSRVFEYLESAKNFFYRNTSTPDVPPGSTDTESIRTNLRKQIDAAEVVVALVTLYTDSPDLLVFQMNYAQSKKKPVLLMGFFGFLALGFRRYDLLRGYSYTIMIFAAVSLSMYYPQYFVSVGDFDFFACFPPSAS